MKELYVTTCVYTKENMKELIKVYYTSPIVYAFFILMIWYPCAGGRLLLNTYVVLVVLVVVLVFVGRLITLKLYRDKRRKYGTEVMIKTVFREEKYDVYKNSNHEHISRDYRNVRRVVETKNLYVLVLRNQEMVLVDKNGFQSGEAEKFLMFIRWKISDRQKG